MTVTATEAPFELVNTLFGTSPLILHAHGRHAFKPTWPPLRDAFFASPRQQYGTPPDLTVVTCNNGHPAMGLFERSLDHLGVPYRIAGQDVDEWVNSVHKPETLTELLAEIDTPYTLYADSRDAILVGAPAIALERYLTTGAGMLFGADRMHWPPCREAKRFERSVAPPDADEWVYLNGGTWIARTELALELFQRALTTSPDPRASDSEQGILRRLFRDMWPTTAIDYRSEIFQNIGFVSRPVVEVVDGGST